MKTELVEDCYELSPIQQGMLFHYLYDEHSGVDIEQMVIGLHEPLDVRAFEQAWQKVVERHAVLRTSFRWKGLGEPVQEVWGGVAVAIERHDRRARSRAEQAEEIEAYLRLDRRRGFNLGEVPLMRLALFQLGDADFQLVWTFHHILIDGRSFVILLEEVFGLYEAICRGETLKLEQPLPYRQYIDWIRQLDHSAAAKFWVEKLKGFSEATPLLQDRRPSSTTTQEDLCGQQEIRLSQALSAALRRLAQQENLTLNTLIQGAWAVLLSRYSNKKDIVFGATRTARRSSVEGAESIVGLFLNTIPVRVPVRDEMPVLTWLKELRSEWVSLRNYAQTPLVKIKEWSESPANAQLFQSLVVFEHQRFDSVLRARGGSWQRREFRLLEQTSYPLTLAAYGDPEVLLKIEYDRCHFEHLTITRMLGHLRTLLEGVAARPTEPLLNLQLLTEAERHQLLVEWNDTRLDYPRDRCLHELIEAQAERSPESVALVYEQQQLTYREMNARANQLARHLQALGVGPEVCVGICMERSPEMVLGLLGILKAGGAYVPLDPAYPKERLAFMLADSRVPVLLTQRRLLEILPSHTARVLCLDPDWWAGAKERPENPVRVSGATPEDLAYVIYTSGSTGRPKGVQIPHRALCNLIETQVRTCGVRPGDRVLQFCSLSFDPSIFEIGVALRSGATLVVAQQSSLLPGPALARVFRDQAITTIVLPPSVLSPLPDGPFLSLQTLVVGAEPVTAEFVKRWENGRRIFNIYGATETTVFSTTAACRADGRKPSIGRPIANTQIYLLDPYLRPVPVGVPGELYVGGVGLARGYLNRPELTAERFIPDPFGSERGSRLYKTGDMARYLPDGNIDFLGRADYQVKVRGHRIELEEIEAMLGQHPAVRETVVAAREDVAGDQRLVAYVVAKSEQTPTLSEMRSLLKAKLPDYMVPSAFVMLEALPPSPSGKVDRRALPAPDRARPELEGAFVAPRNAVEEVLVGIWAEILSVERVGICDNFFELGGHSLLATRLASRLCSTFQVELPLRDVFETPTVAGLAESVEAALRHERPLQAPPMKPAPRTGAAPLSFAQQRLWLLDLLEHGRPTYNVPAVFRLRGRLDVSALERSINYIIERHETLRTSFVAVDGQPVQVAAPVLTVTLPVIDLSMLPEGERESAARRLATEEGQRIFELSRGPLLRAALLELGEEERWLLLTMHHIVSDAWSMGVLTRELGALYEALAAGKPSPLPELSIQYSDFAHWQRQLLQGEVLEGQLSYWRKRLEAAPVALDLPTDRPRRALQSSRGASQSFVLSNTLSDELKRLSRREGVTLFMTLVAAFQTLLYRYTGEEDVLVGTPIANRNRLEIEGMIGFFVNTLVLRTDLSGDPSFRELLGRVREVALGAYAHQDLPFEKLVEELQPERDLSRNPLFQVMFILQNAPMPNLELPNLTASFVEVETGTAKFDLTLSMRDSEQGLSGAFEYNTDLFKPATITRMVCHWRTLLQGIVGDPDRRLSDLPLLTNAERYELLVERNDTKADYPQDNCIHQLFEAQVEQTPAALAVVYEAQELSYQDLNTKANQVAHYLRQQGVGPEMLVGICLDRSPEMVVGLLAVLKAGGAYVPLDPSYPPERLAFMLEDAQVGVLLTQQTLVRRFPATRAKVICLDADGAEIGQQPQENPHSGVGPENLAYVIYTSGSTGTPKGVLGLHGASVNRFAWMWETYPFEADEVCCHKTSVNFVDSVWELFGPLLKGIPNVILPEKTTDDLQRLVQTLIVNRVTRFALVPSLLRTIMGTCADNQACMPRLSFWTVSGEHLPVELAQRLLNSVSSGRVLNLYGSSEDSADVTCYEVQRGGGLSCVPIGRPIANTQIYLLDEHLHPVPVGVAGELCIGGAGLARGYLNRPELTAEKFIPNPFSNEPGARLYRTGDLARYLPDGNIEFLGRLDQQVKIRGFRVEPGEIEAVLGEHATVRESVVVAREDVAGDKRLVAYIVPKQQQAPTLSELRSLLKAKLPDYMVPSAFVMLDTLPLSPNGKVDRHALPAPDRSRPELEGAFVAPRNAVEEVLAGIWAEILGVERVGIYDNFFELGGHSLLATQLVSRLRNTFQVELPLRCLFDAPTLPDLSRAIVANETKPGQTERIAQILKRIEGMSAVEARAALQKKRTQDVEA